MLRFSHHSLDVSKLQVIDCVRQKIFEKQLKKDISMAQKQIAMVEFFSIFFFISMWRCLQKQMLKSKHLKDGKISI